jgi:hypothetical protein
MRIEELQKLSIKPTHVPHEEIEMDSDSYADLKADISRQSNLKDGRGKRIAFRMSEEHLNRKDLNVVPKSSTDVNPFQAAALNISEMRYTPADQKDLSLVVISDSSNATLKSSVRFSIVIGPSCTDSAV